MSKERFPSVTASAVLVALISGCASTLQAPLPATAVQHAPTRQMGPAATSLVARSHEQASGGDFVAAYATLERAQRIEPSNPLLWVEMGQLRVQSGNAVQATSLGHKALRLASGDPAAQSRAWQLIADSLKAQGKDPESADAQRHADALAPR